MKILIVLVVMMLMTSCCVEVTKRELDEMISPIRVTRKGGDALELKDAKDNKLLIFKHTHWGDSLYRNHKVGDRVYQSKDFKSAIQEQKEGNWLD